MYLETEVDFFIVRGFYNRANTNLKKIGYEVKKINYPTLIFKAILIGIKIKSNFSGLSKSLGILM